MKLQYIFFFLIFLPMCILIHCQRFKSLSESKSLIYHKFTKYSDTQTICCNHAKIQTIWLCNWEMCPKDMNGIANSVDPDQTALGAVWSGSTLFAQTYLSKNLGTIRFCLCWGLTSQSTIFQSCRDGATASWVIKQYFQGIWYKFPWNGYLYLQNCLTLVKLLLVHLF